MPFGSWPEKPCQAPSTVSTPAKPRPTPANRCRDGRSSDSATTETSIAKSGVAALHIPASIDGMVFSAVANRVNGSAFSRKAATVRCSQVRPPRGSRSRLTATTVASTAVPNTIRPRVTWSGANASLPTFMNRKLNPQIRPSAAKRIRQSTTLRGPAGTAAGEVATATAGVSGSPAVVAAAGRLSAGAVMSLR